MWLLFEKKSKYVTVCLEKREIWLFSCASGGVIIKIGAPVEFWPTKWCTKRTKMYNFCPTIGAPAKKMVHRFASDERERRSARGPEIFLQFGINLSIWRTVSPNGVPILLPHLCFLSIWRTVSPNGVPILLPHLRFLSIWRTVSPNGVPILLPHLRSICSIWHKNLSLSSIDVFLTFILHPSSSSSIFNHQFLLYISISDPINHNQQQDFFNFNHDSPFNQINSITKI